MYNPPRKGPFRYRFVLCRDGLIFELMACHFGESVADRVVNATWLVDLYYADGRQHFHNYVMWCLARIPFNVLETSRRDLADLPYHLEAMAGRFSKEAPEQHLKLHLSYPVYRGVWERKIISDFLGAYRKAPRYTGCRH